MTCSASTDIPLTWTPNIWEPMGRFRWSDFGVNCVAIQAQVQHKTTQLEHFHADSSQTELKIGENCYLFALDNPTLVSIVILGRL